MLIQPFFPLNYYSFYFDFYFVLDDFSFFFSIADLCGVDRKLNWLVFFLLPFLLSIAKAKVCTEHSTSDCIAAHLHCLHRTPYQQILNLQHFAMAHFSHSVTLGRVNWIRLTTKTMSITCANKTVNE